MASSPFMFGKAAAVVGVSNPHVCAVMRWGSLDDFLKTRHTQVLYSVLGPIPTAIPPTPRPGPSM
jgi:gallate dioxygenase